MSYFQMFEPIASARTGPWASLDWTGSLESIWSNPPPKAGLTADVAQATEGFVQLRFYGSSKMESTTSLDNLF